MIIYTSRTGNVRYIVSKLIGIKSLEIDNVQVVDCDYILFTYTDGLGKVPLKVESFMKKHQQYCKGVICSGNSNFGEDLFCRAGDILSNQYDIPLISKVDLRGFEKDYNYIIDQYNVIMKGVIE